MTREFCFQLNALGGGSQNLGMSGGSGGAQFGRPIVKAGAQPLNPLSPGVYRNTPQSQPSAAPSHVPQHNQFASVANLMSAAASANQRPIVGGGSGVMSSQLSPDALRVAQMQAQLQAANSMCKQLYIALSLLVPHSVISAQYFQRLRIRVTCRACRNFR